jgi:hypothetical protein
MASRSLALGAVVLVCLTAGCAGLFGAGGEGTLTPVPDIEQPAPGVPAAGEGSTQLSVTSERLLAANDRALAAGTYTLDRRVTVRAANGTMHINRTVRHGTGTTSLEQLHIKGEGDLTSVVDRGVRWTEGEKTWTRTQLSSGRYVFTQRLVEDVHPYGYGPDLDNQVLDAMSFTVEERPDGNGAVLRSDGSFDMGEGLVALDVGPARNATARLVVEASGLVRELDLTYTGSYGNRTVSVTVSHRITGQNAAAPARPEWVPTNRTAS